MCSTIPTGYLLANCEPNSAFAPDFNSYDLVTADDGFQFGRDPKLIATLAVPTSRQTVTSVTPGQLHASPTVHRARLLVWENVT